MSWLKSTAFCFNSPFLVHGFWLLIEDHLLVYPVEEICAKLQFCKNRLYILCHQLLFERVTTGKSTTLSLPPRWPCQHPRKIKKNPGHLRPKKVAKQPNICVLQLDPSHPCPIQLRGSHHISLLHYCSKLLLQNATIKTVRSLSFLLRRFYRWVSGRWR